MGKLNMDVMESVDSQRALLESNMHKLKSGLQQWRTWDMEYEGLKEELQGLDEEAGSQELSKIATEFGGQLLTHKEISEIMSLDKKQPRRPEKVIDLIEKRQDYVQQNIAIMSRQLDSAEQAIAILEAQEDLSAEDGNQELPMSEIVEELDDDDNVISSHVQRPQDTASGLIETLQKAGVKDIADGAPKAAKPSTQKEITAASTTAKASSKQDTKQQHLSTSRSGPPHDSFNSLEEVMQPDESHTAPTTNISIPVDHELLKGSFKPGDHVFQIDDEDALLAASAVLPKDDSAEEAQLRREMLRYHLNEVGNVVAEIDLLEGSDDDDDDYDELEDLEDDEDNENEETIDDEDDADDDEIADMLARDDASVRSDLSEDEDEFGRGMRPVITEQYRAEMRALEARLRAGFMANAGPDEALLLETPQAANEAPPTTQLPTRPKPQKANSQKTKPESTASTKAAKGVRFAENLDIQEIPASGAGRSFAKPQTLAGQRAMAAQSDGQAPKPSRFKQARSQKNDTPTSNGLPEQAPQPILANSILERDSITAPARDADPDDFDEELQRRQLAATYYQKRNDIVRQQGGFKVTEEDKEDPLIEELEDGRTRKVSRFKAARMGRGDM